jgi:RNA polymerase sigma-70 factor, ECF subfamily
MKVSQPRPHVRGVRLAPALQPDPEADLGLAATPDDRAPRAGTLGWPLDFTAVYDRHFDDVLRWARACGARPSELEDVAQEVFIVVRRKLPSFDGGNLVAWLYKIVKLTVSDHRRRAWFQRVFRGQRAVDVDELPSANRDPEGLLQGREQQGLFYRLVGEMTRKRRETFLLYEVEGYSGEEIARLQDVPINTVWTRLHQARKELVEKVRALGPEAAASASVGKDHGAGKDDGAGKEKRTQARRAERT